jgi:nitrite reductase/ring-hydroxylating ferredoxin subunit
MTNKIVWKSHDKVCLLGMVYPIYIIKGFISKTNLVILVLANSSESPYCLLDPCSHSETPNTLDSSASYDHVWIKCYTSHDHLWIKCNTSYDHLWVKCNTSYDQLWIKCDKSHEHLWIKCDTSHDQLWV